MQKENRDRIADSPEGSWVAIYAPPAMRPYLYLIRIDRTIGIWLLLWPCWWSLAMSAGISSVQLPDFWLLFTFALGAFIMRSAGCAYNDIIDRKIDAQVLRTRNRPIPKGQISLQQAWILVVALCLAGFLVLLSLNWLTICVGIASLLLVAVYPFMKRIVWWPQLFLGFAFNWGVILGWTAETGRIAAIPPFLLYAGGIFWTLGYDTIYASLDREDDARIGIRSTARYFGRSSRFWVALFYTFSLLFMTIAGLFAAMGVIYMVALLVAAGQAGWQISICDPDNPERCLRAFRSNRFFGAIIFLGIILDTLFRTAIQV